MKALWVRAGLFGLFVAWGMSGIPADSAEAGTDGKPPNIVLILTDDEDVQIHKAMPKTKALIDDQGAVFENYFVSYSFCCPSRATILRGQYPHNHRIQGNVLPAGGARKFRAMGEDQSTIATWLQAAGYHTALYGKYMNDYSPEEGYVPPGWDEWYGAAWAYFNYPLNENGKLVRYSNKPEDYITDVLARHATNTIREASAAHQPFFLYIAPVAPHSPTISAPRHEKLFAAATYPRSPSFDEVDVSDKPSLIRDLPPLTAEQIEAIDSHYRARLRSLQAVDDLVESVIKTLEETGQLDNTYVIYSSDNGWHMGEHRQLFGKTTAYEEDIRVPFVMRGPGVPRGAKLTPFVLNNDLAPTFAAIAGVTPPPFVDGRSFLPLLEKPQQSWRQSFAIEREQLENFDLVGPANFHAIRTADWTYIEYGNGERELYDLRADPNQLNNVAAKEDPVLVSQLSQRLAQLANCAADYCRKLEDEPLAPTLTATTDEAPTNQATTTQ
jgi:arylsulfatase A-like enzyme